MGSSGKEIISCSAFEEALSEYIDGELGTDDRTLMAEHSLKCPLCHSLLNEVKAALSVCREVAAPAASLTGLEARILTSTMPETSMSCEDFEENLTDYLDGFLSATLFHRWERHAVLCENCTDLPGEVVRSIAACYTYKTDELPLPADLKARILTTTIGTAEAAEVRAPLGSRLREWIREVSVPFSVPQLAPVAMMLLFAALVFSQITGGSIGGMYQKSFELAGKTYKEGADMVMGDLKGDR